MHHGHCCGGFPHLSPAVRAQKQEPESPDSLRRKGEKKTLVQKIDRLLRGQYGFPRKMTSAEPLDVLMQTILSQNTNDANSHRAFEKLRIRFDQWDAVMLAPVGQIEEAIHIGGLAKTKARRIQKILSQIHDRNGSLSLRHLCAMTPSDAAAILEKFEGVGRKTINCVLLFGCDMDVFPVDTHILRISKRMGLIPEKTGMERAHTLWATFLPANSALPLHLNLIRHGRLICRARVPQCSECCLKRLCKRFLRQRMEDEGGSAMTRISIQSP